MLVLMGDVMAPRSKLTSSKSATQQADLFAKSTEELAREAKSCRNCPLWKNATQTVFGTGSPKARIMLVGEQPGNDEDLSGKPFVGPAGRLLDASLAAAGIDRAEVYVTNVVKHFNGSRAASAASTRSRGPAKLRLVVPGSMQKSLRLRRLSLYAWARRQLKRCSEIHFASPPGEANSSRRRSLHM